MAVSKCVFYLAILNIIIIKYSYGLHLRKVYPEMELKAKRGGDTGDPLMLTPYVEKGDIELGQILSRVNITENLGFISHSGFFTVNKSLKSNLYFWYFPALYNTDSAPVVLWLQGGPGGSSLFGLFVENGPLIVTKKGFSLRKHHWALSNHLIYIDNPVGTGFSFTGSDEGFCNDETCVAKNLYSCMQQFFDLFPKLRNKDFYITGESYAGKYVPSLAMEIHKQNMNNNKRINLQGLAMGNGYCDPVNQMDYGNYLYQHGLLDDNQKNVFIQKQNQIAAEVRAENWLKADLLMDELMDNYYFKNYTGFETYYNILKTSEEDDMSLLLKMLNTDGTRKSVHVGGLPFNLGKKVALHLAIDGLKSVAPVISELLSNYRIMFYNGQLDIIVAYPLTENFLRNLNFSSAEEYRTASRKIWRVDNEIAGYYKKAGNLTEVLVRNAGHMVPSDQPKWALDLITRFIKNKL